MSISIFRSIANQYEHLRSVSTVSMMNTISHQIEEQVIRHRIPVDFYAGFQLFSRFPAQVRRYQQLGMVCRRVFVFGVPDARPPAIPGVEYVEIDTMSPLTREWFLCVDTPDFWTLLSTQEVDSGRDAINGGRRYDGLWTFDVQVVERASLLLSQVSNGFFQPTGRRNYESQNQHIAEMNGRMIEMLERSRLSVQRRWKQMNTLHKVTETVVKTPQAPALLGEVARILHMIMGAPSAAVLFRAEGEGYSVIAGEGDIGRGATVRSGEGAAGRAISSGGVVNVPDARKARERDPLMPAMGSILAVPMSGRRGVYGALVIGDYDANGFSDDDAKTLSAAASLIAAALELRASDTSGADVPKTTAGGEQLRGPIAYMLLLHQKLRAEADMSIMHRQILDRVMNLTMELAQSVGISESMITRILTENIPS
jgi:hypothetical protein